MGEYPTCNEGRRAAGRDSFGKQWKHSIESKLHGTPGRSLCRESVSSSRAVRDTKARHQDSKEHEGGHCSGQSLALPSSQHRHPISLEKLET